MIIGGLIIVGAVVTGGWIYHHLFMTNVVHPLQRRIRALESGKKK